MKNLNTKFDFDDILIMPSVSTEITSRYKDITLPEILPLFTAPMDTVVNLDNIDDYIDNRINITLPRTVKYIDFLKHSSNYYDRHHIHENIFISLGFEDIDKPAKFYGHDTRDFAHYQPNTHILIDVANGHMSKIINYAKDIKTHRPDIKIMVGNIANPKTYTWYAEQNCVDYIRVGIGNGGGCWVDGTKIATKNNGLINIEDVEIGEMVLTHNKTYQEVISKVSYPTSEKLLEVNGEICTDNHKIYVANSSDVHQINDDNYLDFCYWVEAKNINEDLHVVISFEND